MVRISFWFMLHGVNILGEIVHTMKQNAETLRRVIPVVFQITKHSYVILSSIIQLANYMFRPLGHHQVVLSLQRTVLHNQCI